MSEYVVKIMEVISFENEENKKKISFEIYSDALVIIDSSGEKFTIAGEHALDLSNLIDKKITE